MAANFSVLLTVTFTKIEMSFLITKDLIDSLFSVAGIQPMSIGILVTGKL
jgi:hypothetical protein